MINEVTTSNKAIEPANRLMNLHCRFIAYVQNTTKRIIGIASESIMPIVILQMFQIMFTTRWPVEKLPLHATSLSSNPNSDGSD